MEFLTINDLAQRSGLPKPTIYRMFHEMSDLVPHKRVGRKILFPEEAVAKITEIRMLTKEEGLTYQMIREGMFAAAPAEKQAKKSLETAGVAQITPRLPEVLSRSVAAGFEGLREDLQLLAAQIDRQNDLLSRFLAMNQTLEGFPPNMVEEEFRLKAAEMVAGNGEREDTGWPENGEEEFADRRPSGFRVKWSNFWAGKGWRA